MTLTTKTITLPNGCTYTHIGTRESIQATAQKVAARQHAKLTVEEQREVMRSGGQTRRIERAMLAKACEVWRACKARGMGYDDTLAEIVRQCGVTQHRARALAKLCRERRRGEK